MGDWFPYVDENGVQSEKLFFNPTTGETRSETVAVLDNSSTSEPCKSTLRTSTTRKRDSSFFAKDPDPRLSARSKAQAAQRPALNVCRSKKTKRPCAYTFEGAGSRYWLGRKTLFAAQRALLSNVTASESEQTASTPGRPEDVGSFAIPFAGAMYCTQTLCRRCWRHGDIYRAHTPSDQVDHMGLCRWLKCTCQRCSDGDSYSIQVPFLQAEVEVPVGGVGDADLPITYKARKWRLGRWLDLRDAHNPSADIAWIPGLSETLLDMLEDEIDNPSDSSDKLSWKHRKYRGPVIKLRDADGALSSPAIKDFVAALRRWAAREVEAPFDDAVDAVDVDTETEGRPEPRAPNDSGGVKCEPDIRLEETAEPLGAVRSGHTFKVDNEEAVLIDLTMDEVEDEQSPSEPISAAVLENGSLLRILQAAERRCESPIPMDLDAVVAVKCEPENSRLFEDMADPEPLEIVRSGPTFKTEDAGPVLPGDSVDEVAHAPSEPTPAAEQRCEPRTPTDLEASAIKCEPENSRLLEQTEEPEPPEIVSSDPPLKIVSAETVLIGRAGLAKSEAEKAHSPSDSASGAEHCEGRGAVAVKCEPETSRLFEQTVEADLLEIVYSGPTFKTEDEEAVVIDLTEDEGPYAPSDRLLQLNGPASPPASSRSLSSRLRIKREPESTRLFAEPAEPEPLEFDPFGATTVKTEDVKAVRFLRSRAPKPTPPLRPPPPPKEEPPPDQKVIARVSICMECDTVVDTEHLFSVHCCRTETPLPEDAETYTFPFKTRRMKQKRKKSLDSAVEAPEWSTSCLTQTDAAKNALKCEPDIDFSQIAGETGEPAALESSDRWSPIQAVTCEPIVDFSQFEEESASEPLGLGGPIEGQVTVKCEPHSDFGQFVEETTASEPLDLTSKWGPCDDGGEEAAPEPLDLSKTAKDQVSVKRELDMSEFVREKAKQEHVENLNSPYFNFVDAPVAARMWASHHPLNAFPGRSPWNDPKCFANGRVVQPLVFDLGVGANDAQVSDMQFSSEDLISL